MITAEQIKDLYTRLQTLHKCLDIDNKRATWTQMEEQSQAPSFWDDPKKAEAFMKEMNALKAVVNTYQSAQSAIEDLEVLLELDPEGEDSDAAIAQVRSQIEDMELRNMLGGEGDSLGAVLTINSGAGGTEANDWSAMLMRMYMRWGERNGYKMTVTEQQEGDETGIKSATIQYEGDYAYGYLKAESGANEGLERIKGFIGEEFDTKVEIVENGVHYMVDVKDGQKTGFFLDQKYNRLAIQKLCKDAKVLDCFTHTGSFALNAGIAGAGSVLGVDASQLAVDQATENAALNGLSDIVKFQCSDVFELLPELEKKKEQFDVVILDPPAFTKSRNSIKNAVKGYREINLRAMKLVRDGGFLATCSCSHFMSYELFTKTINEAARNVHKRLRQVEFRTQAPDHPILWAADESYYLKFYIFQVCDER